MFFLRSGVLFRRASYHEGRALELLHRLSFSSMTMLAAVPRSLLSLDAARKERAIHPFTLPKERLHLSHLSTSYLCQLAPAFRQNLRPCMLSSFFFFFFSTSTELQAARLSLCSAVRLIPFQMDGCTSSTSPRILLARPLYDGHGTNQAGATHL